MKWLSDFGVYALLFLAGSCVIADPECLPTDASCNPFFIKMLYTGREQSVESVFIVTEKISTVAFFYSLDGQNWSAPESIPVGLKIYNFAYGNGIFVGAGESGSIIYSRNLKQWSAASSPTANNLNDIAFGAGRFVAVGPSGTVIHSVNGMDWFTATIAGNPTLNNILFAYGYFAASQTIASSIYYSLNGESGSWVQRPVTGTSFYLSAGNNVWLSSSGSGDVEVMDPFFQTVFDQAISLNGGGNSVSFGAGAFYHHSASGGRLARSVNGTDLTWQAILTGCPTSSTAQRISGFAYGNGVYIVAGQDNASNRVLCRSTTGLDLSYADVTPVTATGEFANARFLSTEPHRDPRLQF